MRRLENAGIPWEASVVVLGIDIGGAQIKAGMVDEAGAILASRTVETPADLDGLFRRCTMRSDG